MINFHHHYHHYYYNTKKDIAIQDFIYDDLVCNLGGNYKIFSSIVSLEVQSSCNF